MSRADLEGIPEHPLPAGFRLRWFEPGDEQVWREIQSVADVYDSFDASRHAREFGTDVTALAQRQCFLCTEAGDPVGTATAWHDDIYLRPEYGRVHWVAVVPDHQGRGLSKPLMTSVCFRLRELGHQKVYLTTSTARVVAINLYLAFGFVPQPRDEAEREAWHRLRRSLKHPFDLADPDCLGNA
jgi:GNAT superfamily N-acetyltransferase